MKKIALFINGELGLSVLESFSSQESIEIICINYYLAQANDKERYYQPSEHQLRWENILETYPHLVSQEATIYSKASIDLLRQKKVDWIILCGWPEIIQSTFLEQFPKKVINIHPSLLPKYKGPNPYYAAINQGEVETGFTLHQVIEDVDSGPILYQSKIIAMDTELETGLSLQQKIALAFQSQVLDVIQSLETPIFIEQANKGNWVSLPKPPFIMDWQNTPESISRQTRAMYPWGSFKTQLGGFNFLLGPGYVHTQQHQASGPGRLLCYSLSTGAVFSSIRPNQVIVFPEIQLHGYPLWVFWILKPLLLRKQEVPQL